MSYFSESRIRGRILATAVFVAVLTLIVVTDLEGFARMPGDMGDSRLNNIFLENVWQVLIGRSESFVHLPFFWPFPFVIGFSDNLWGSAPFYVFFRVIGADPKTAFQLWFYFGFVVNFIAMQWVLRRLGFSLVASITASVFYTFCLPGLVQSGHVQLHYRCAIPFAVYFFCEWLRTANVKSLISAMLWSAWQFWLGMYMGIFLLIFLLALFGVGMVQKQRERTFPTWIRAGIQSVRTHKVLALVGFFVVFGLMALLFYPYGAVSWIYGSHRSWAETATMLPRLQSYFLMDNSSIYGNISQRIAPLLPMRWEHQIFIGVIPFILLLVGICKVINTASPRKVDNGTVTFARMNGWALLGVFVVTLSVAGASLWWIVAKIPLFNAPRAMARVVLIMIFPASVLIALGVEQLRRIGKGGHLVAWCILIALTLEAGAVQIPASNKAEWDSREAMTLSKLGPVMLQPSDVIFLAQSTEWWLTELDAMWAAQQAGAKTMNGYSGFLPPGSTWQFGSDVNEAENRFIKGREVIMKLGIPLDLERYQLRCVGFSSDCSSLSEMRKRSMLNSGDVEHFSSENHHRILLEKGFSNREDWGVWTNGKVAVMKFYVGSQHPSRVRLTFKVFGDNTHSQRVKFTMNDQLVLEGKFSVGEATVMLPIPSGDTVIMHLTCPDAISPKELGLSRDRRLLSLGMIRAEFLN